MCMLLFNKADSCCKQGEITMKMKQKSPTEASRMLHVAMPQLCVQTFGSNLGQMQNQYI